MNESELLKPTTNYFLTLYPPMPLLHWDQWLSEFEEHVNERRSDAGSSVEWKMNDWLHPSFQQIATGEMNTDLFSLMMNTKLAVALCEDDASPFDPSDLGMACTTGPFLTCLNSTTILAADGFIPFYDLQPINMVFNQVSEEQFNVVWLSFEESYTQFLQLGNARSSGRKKAALEPKRKTTTKAAPKEREIADWFGVTEGRAREMMLKRALAMEANADTITKQFQRLVDRVADFEQVKQMWSKNELVKIIALLDTNHGSKLFKLDTDGKLLAAAKKCQKKLVQVQKDEKDKKAAPNGKAKLPTIQPRQPRPGEGSSKHAALDLTRDDILQVVATSLKKAAGEEVDEEVPPARGTSNRELNKIVEKLSESVKRVETISTQLQGVQGTGSPEHKKIEDLKNMMACLFSFVKIEDHDTYRKFRKNCLRIKIPVEIYLHALMNTKYYDEEIEGTEQDRIEKKEYVQQLERQASNELLGFEPF